MIENGTTPNQRLQSAEGGPAAQMTRKVNRRTLMRTTTDMHARDESVSKELRWLLAMFFALAPNAFAFVVAYFAGSLCALAYCCSLPGAFLLSQWGLEEPLAAYTGILLNVLLDAWIVYQVTAPRNGGLSTTLFMAYVGISRIVAFCWILFLSLPYGDWQLVLQCR
jgi:hypothetical protein